MVELIDESDDEKGGLPHPRFPKSIMAVVGIWILTLAILYFDRLQEIQTNFVVFFSIPMAFALLFMPKDSWQAFIKGAGLAMDTTRAKIMTAVGIIAGAVVGYLIFFFLTTTTSIVPLFFPVWISALPPVGIVALYSLVAFSEEFYVIFYAKVSHNWLHDKFKIGKMNGLIIGVVIARIFWSALHWFSYSGALNPTMYIVAWGLGMMFSFGAIGLALFSEHKHLTIFCIVAHLVYDVAIGLLLSGG